MDRKKLGAFNALFSIFIFIALLIVINILAYKYHAKLDFTENSIYSLSKESREIAKGVESNFIVKCFFSRNLPENYMVNKRYLKDLLHEYSSLSNGKISYEFIDPEESTEWKSKLQSLGIPGLQITGVTSDKFEVKNIYMGIAFFYGDKKEVIPILRTPSNLEYNITKIISKLTSKQLQTIGFLSASGTAIPEIDMKSLTEVMSEYLDIKTVKLIKYIGIEKGTDILVVANPRMQLSEWTKFQIDQFIMSGKPVIFLVDMSSTDFTNMSSIKSNTDINTLLQKYGVKVSEELIADSKNQRIGLEKMVGGFVVQNTINYPFYPVFTDINRDFTFLSDFDGLYFPIINRIEIIDNSSKSNIHWLFKSSPKSFLQNPPYDIDPYQNFDPSKFNSNEQYIGGVIIDGALESAYNNVDLNKLNDPDIEKKVNKEDYEKFDLNQIKKSFISKTDKAKVIVIGDSDFIKDALMDKTMESFFMNMVDWLIDNRGLMNIRSKGIKLRLIDEPSSSVKLFIKVFNIVVPTILLLLIGFFIRARWGKKY